MFFYFVLALIVGVFAELSVKTKSKVVKVLSTLVVIILPSFFFAVRFGIGTDYFSYLRIFERINNGIESRMEWGYFTLNYLVAKLNGNIEIVFFITAILMMAFVFYSIKSFNNYFSTGVSMFIFMLLYYQMSFNTVRQALTMAIILYSIRFITERKLLKFIILVIFASSFHISALLFLPIYFIYGIIGNKKRKLFRYSLYILILIIIFSLGNLISPILNSSGNLEYYSKYLENENTNAGLGFIVRSLPFIAFGVYLFKKDKFNSKFTIYFSIYMLSLLLKFTSFIGADYIGRVSWNFEIVLIILIPYYIRLLNKKRELFFSWGLLCYIVIHWWYIYFYIGSHGTFPYQWIYSN
ncbi:EpsG family protein [Halalkalibacter flavus]|uniref:EpsG family protein n=1 Tax=Halalkalibacter flavus TaxID=3090668 RepID=UPI002FCC9018